MPNAGKDIDKLAVSDITGGNVKWYNQLQLATSLAASYETKYTLTCIYKGTHMHKWVHVKAAEIWIWSLV